MTKQIELATKPYGPPFAADRAWQAEDREGWTLDAMRDGFIDVLDAVVKIDEHRAEMREPAHPGIEVTHFRSNRISGSRAIDAEIVIFVMAMTVDDDENEIEKIAQWRRETADQFNAYPRAVLDAFHTDVIGRVEEAGEYDKLMAQRWANAWYEMESPAARWLGRESKEP